MQNTVDHTNISELAKLVGAEYTPVSGDGSKEQTGNGPVS